jgi:[acyl-carrier-protein] S-malonyltransferase
MKFDLETTAFVFPGQGSQTVGMGKELALQYPIAKETFEEADEILGFPFSAILWEGPDADLNDTLNTQPALYIHSLAAYRTFSHLYPTSTGSGSVQAARRSFLASSALAASGALSFGKDCTS